MNNNRRTEAWNKRQAANQMAHDRPHPKHYSNGDEQKFRHKEETAKCHEKKHEDHYNLHDEASSIIGKPSYLMSFTKGMPHDKHTGLLKDPQHFQYFVKAIDSGDPRDFRDTPLGPDAHMGETKNCKAPKNPWHSHKAKHGDKSKVKKGEAGKAVGLRAWESQSAGLAFEIEGPDAQAVTMPPHPKLGSAELTAEMGEVYVQALLRDTPFNAMSAGVICDSKLKNTNSLCTKDTDVKTVKKFTDELNKLDWFGKAAYELCLDSPEKDRHRGNKLTPGNAFRGITRGDAIGPYLSQFLLIGDTGIANTRQPSEGLIKYGAISVEQQVRTATPEVDYMTSWEEWYDVQQAANVSGQETYDDKRFMHTPRDLATYVHFDALYEAYLNACLILLANNIPFDPGIPFQENDSRDHQQGFAHFGGPHILSLVTEVATRALKAVRFQKYNVHRRCRPEVLAARLTKVDDLAKMAKELPKMVHELEPILKHVDKHNKAQNEKDSHKERKHILKQNYLLPMAFCEGSPMHPAYGAGHATVAGACVTILKAFFDSKHLFKPNGEDSSQAYVSVKDGKELKLVPVFDQDCEIAHLTVEGELNKLASNISIGRNWAGVHYFTDYYESLLMGEQIAIGILEEQKLMFGENFSMTVPLFNGDSIRI